MLDQLCGTIDSDKAPDAAIFGQSVFSILYGAASNSSFYVRILVHMHNFRQLFDSTC